MSYERLFSPGKIGGCEIKNRIIMAPYNKNYNARDGSITQRQIDYFVERAKGGAGLLLVGATYVSPESKGHIYQQGLHTDTVIRSYRRLTAAVHEHGAKIGVQLNHRGRQTSRIFNGMVPVAPSAIPGESVVKGKLETPRELNLSDIERIIDDFAEAARRAKEAGFDVIEIHGAHGYLINQFVSPYSNKRQDEYGGSISRRERFALEVVSSVRGAVGDDFPLMFRISADELVEGGMTVKDSILFAQHLEKAGVDLIDVSGGSDRSVAYVVAAPMDVPMGLFVPHAEAIKPSVSIPVSVVGRIDDPQQAEDILAKGQADFISMARGLNADPFFPKKAEEGRGEEILACVACNQGCIDRLSAEIPIECTVNPRSGRERVFSIGKSSKKKKVLVIGGGPAGMEAARVSSLRGHEVTLYEKEQELGGQVRFLVRLPYNKDYEEIIRWFSRELSYQGVRIELGQEATPALIEELCPDAVIVATGADPFVPSIPGIGETGAAIFPEILDRTSFDEKRAVVLGGEVMGCQISEYLADRGVQVALVETRKELAADDGQRHKVYTVKRIYDNAEIDVYTHAAIEAISSDSVTLDTEAGTKTLEGIELFVAAMGTISNRSLIDALMEENRIPELFYVGDCFKPRKTLDAIYEGAEVAYRL